MPSDLSPRYADAISGIESGGKYDLIGPETKGDRAYGKYQIMGSNIGPWSKEILGQEVTPSEFLANPQIQDAIFQGKFGQYVNKYGPEGAAKAWFAGERGMNNPNAKDVLGTTVSDYGAKFMKGIGGAPAAPMSLAPGAPPPLDLASFRQAAYGGPSSMPAFSWSPGPSPQQLAALQPPPLQAPPIQYFGPNTPLRRGFSLRG